MKWLKKLFGIHKCNYVIPETIRGIKFLKCDHPGCNCYDVHPEQEAADKAETIRLGAKVDEILLKRKNMQQQRIDQ